MCLSYEPVCIQTTKAKQRLLTPVMSGLHTCPIRVSLGSTLLATVVAAKARVWTLPMAIVVVVVLLQVPIYEQHVYQSCGLG